MQPFPGKYFNQTRPQTKHNAAVLLLQYRGYNNSVKDLQKVQMGLVPINWYQKGDVVSTSPGHLYSPDFSGAHIKPGFVVMWETLHLCWNWTLELGHHIPKRVLYGGLSECRRSRGRPNLRYKDICTTSLKSSMLSPFNWEELAAWIHLLESRPNEGDFTSERAVSARMEDKRRRQKTTASWHSILLWSYCGRPCHSSIGRLSHDRFRSTKPSRVKNHISNLPADYL
jgi:hypothetical protein